MALLSRVDFLPYVMLISSKYFSYASEVPVNENLVLVYGYRLDYRCQFPSFATVYQHWKAIRCEKSSSSANVRFLIVPNKICS